MLILLLVQRRFATIQPWHYCLFDTNICLFSFFFSFPGFNSFYFFSSIKTGADLGFLQGRVSNPSERGTGGRAPKAPTGVGSREGSQPPPQKIFVFLISKW